MVRPALAEATLGSVLERMAEAMARHDADMGELVGRCEEAIAAVVDPEALSTELAATRAEVALQVADAQDKARSADAARARAEAAARAAADEAQEAGRAADVAWERADSLEAELVEARGEVATAVDRTGEVAAELAAARVEHNQAVAALQAAADVARADALAEQAQAHAAELAAVREAALAEVGVADVARADAVHERARAEGEAAALREDLDRIRIELPQAVAAARAEVTANLRERHAAELAAARATLQGEVARLEGELAGERSRSATEQELLAAYRDQLGVRPPAAAPPGPKATRKRGTAAPQS